MSYIQFWLAVSSMLVGGIYKDFKPYIVFEGLKETEV